MKVTNKTPKRKNFDNGTYKVQGGIEMPHKRAAEIRFPFSNMKVGDSFLIPSKDQNPRSARVSLYTAIRTFNIFNKESFKIATRLDKDGLRVWRTE